MLNADSLATLRRGIETSESVKCCGGTFISQGRDNAEKCVNNLSSMDGKLYRRDFIRSYAIRRGRRAVHLDYRQGKSLPTFQHDYHSRNSVGMLACYTYWSAISTQKPVFAAQSWEYVKKFYHQYYRKFYCPAYANMKENLSADAGDKIITRIAKQQQLKLPDKFTQPISLQEFFTRLRNETYDPEHIRTIWRDMKNSSETRAYIERNELVGVCPKGYADN